MVRFVFVLGFKWGPQTHSEVPPWPRFVPRFWQLQLYHWAILLSQLFPVIFYYPVWENFQSVEYYIYFYFQPSSIHGWTFSLPPRCPQVMWFRWGEIEPFSATLAQVGRAWSAKEKSLEILRRGWESNPGHREDRQWAIPLSCHDWLLHLYVCYIC